MLHIKNLSVKVKEKQILDWINIDFEIGKTYFLLGKNGSGKSSIANTIAWNPDYKIFLWKIELDWKKICPLPPDERQKLWIFLSFQNIAEIPWIKLGEFLRTIYNISAKNKNIDFRDLSIFLFNKFIKKYLEILQIPEDYLQRDLNVWFSWWEKRKIELLQILLLEPKYIILDEIDSWLDIDAFKVVASNLAKIKNTDNTFIFITHNFELINYINVDEVVIIEKWKIIEKWWKELIEKIKHRWYCNFCENEKGCENIEKCS